MSRYRFEEIDDIEYALRDKGYIPDDKHIHDICLSKNGDRIQVMLILDDEPLVRETT
jgi:hypothetical protein